MKHVGKLAIISALLKAVKTSLVRTIRTYLIERTLQFSLAFLAHILQNS